jgi:hypothetical protein
MRAGNIMTDTIPPLHLADEQDDIESKEATVPDRRESAWRDPRTWLAFAALLIAVGTTLLGFIASQLTAINQSVKTTHDIVLTVTTRQAAEIKALEERLAKAESAIDTQNKAYNFNFTTRLAGVEAALKLKQKTTDEE